MKKQVLLTCMALGLSAAAFAQSNVTTGATKNVLVHEGTGAWCGWCVDGALRLEQMATADPKVIGLSVHNGDGMAFADGNTYNNTYATGYPYGTVDNATQTLDNSNPNGVGMNRGYWQSVVTSQEAKTASYQVTMTHAYDASTRTITVTVTGKTLAALTGTYNFNVYVVEDSVTGATGSQYSQKNFYSGNASYPTHPYYSLPGTIDGYVHRKVLRAMLGGPWGTSATVNNPPLGSTAAKTFTYVLPAGAIMSRFKLVGVVLKNNATDKNDREVSNSVQAKFVPAKLAVSSLTALDDIATYPNPANNTVRVTGSFHNASDLQLSLSNSLGQVVLSKNVSYSGSSVCDESLDVSSLSNGIYFLNVRSEEGHNTVRVLVSH